MNVAIVDDEVCYPPTSSKQQRTLHLMLPLARRHRISYIAPGQDGDYLRSQGVLPFLVGDPRRLREAVGHFAVENPVDLWQVEAASCLETVDAGLAPVILQVHAIETVRFQRREEQRRGLWRWWAARQRRRVERFENRAFHQAARLVTPSPEDAAVVEGKFHVGWVDVVDNGVDTAFFRDVRPLPASRCILYPCRPDSRPHRDALRLLRDTIFPNVQAHEPAARLVVVGGKPGAAELPGVEVHAPVADLKPYLAQALVLALPLPEGGEARAEVLEALAAGLPVVASRRAVEGLALRPDRDYTLADTPEQQAAALIGCLRQPERTLALAERGRQTVRDAYDWQVLARRLERVWEKTVAYGLESRTRQDEDTVKW
jgi:glycosyltransferase involved in cell wall biosynthesis